MGATQLRSNRQLMDSTVTLPKLVTNFAQGTTWALSADNTTILSGISDPISANDVANKQYVDGLVNTTFKSPDAYITAVNGDYPSDYKGTGVVSEGDSFYITSIINGTLVGTITVNAGDMLVALVNNPGNIDASWLVMESNRDLATTTVPGIVELATQVETDAGVDTSRGITPATLAGYIASQGINKIAGLGLSEDLAFNFNIGATDASITVAADTIAVGLGSTNGASLETTATGVELAAIITGARSFTGGAFSVDSGAGLVSIKSGGTLTIDATADNTVLTTQPTGAVALAVATTSYVDTAVNAGTEIYNELPIVTDGSANITLANTPTAGTERVYLNGARQSPGGANDYTVSGTTVTFAIALQTGDQVLVDYKF